MSKADFVRLLEEYADDDSHGYNQANRWGPDYDCSSLIYTLAYKAGLLPNYSSAPTSGYTGSMLADFTANGWTAVEFDGNIYDMAPGDVVLQVVNHVEGVVNSNTWIAARRDERGQYSGGTPGDNDGGEICRSAPYHYGSYPNDWDYVLIPPSDKQEAKSETILSGVTYRVHTANGWTPAVSKASNDHWAGDGKPIDAIQLFRNDGKQVIVEVMAGDTNLGKTTFAGSLTGVNAEGDGFAGDFGHALTRIALDSPGMSLQVKVSGVWLSPLCDGRTAEGDWFAGDVEPIEGLRCWV